ncbi:hypothetical protein K488DRAFT_54266 [Vararia minispora EC-137]|uniref:Uncharacterized protein n=1 Tax=Vararia minispora EC-137 TaxID=1314806 RepID=A0ACB8QFL3_9AGAM|nr:hypothetical protein K488DRAFT_54266 [Vararia minispora EC-137]
MAEYDEAFTSLSQRLRRKIDLAFDNAAGISLGHATGAGMKASPPAPGGFLPDEGAAPGGFMLDDDAAGRFLPSSPTVSQGFIPPSLPAPEARRPSPDDLIPLSKIPHALQLLDLPPSDEEVLSVFRHAASGWGEYGSEEGEESVNRRDWRAVCSALLGEDEETDEPSVRVNGAEQEREADEDEFNRILMDVDDSEGDGSSDEYIEEITRPKKRGSHTRARTSARKTHVRRAKNQISESEDDGDVTNQPLTARQKRECLNAFALFFPDVPVEILPQRRLGVKELIQAANLLKEGMKVEEMIEMLEMFSSTPDKTVGLPDFERMMVTARMA